MPSLLALPLVASAVDAPAIEPSTTRMGGKLDPYTDVAKGFSIYKPSTWNKFDATPGEYDVKFQDVVGVTEQITISSSPVTEGKQLDALGTPEELGQKVAKLRSLDLQSSRAYKIGPNLTYILELQGAGGHEFIGFTVSKGKLWRITAKASDKSWDRNKEMYMNVVTSFQNKIL